MVDPGLDAGVKVLPVQPAQMIGVGKAFEPTAKAVAVIVAQSSEGGKHPIAQQIQPCKGLGDVGFAQMQTQSVLDQAFKDRRFNRTCLIIRVGACPTEPDGAASA